MVINSSKMNNIFIRFLMNIFCRGQLHLWLKTMSNHVSEKLHPLIQNEGSIVPRYKNKWSYLLGEQIISFHQKEKKKTEKR
jgi:hypothetical protein